MSIQASGVNLLPQDFPLPPDMHCPQLPGEMNLHRSSCCIKQRKGGPCSTTKCHEGWAVSGRTEVEKKKPQERAKKGQEPMCESCGKVKALPPEKLSERGASRPLCSACISSEKKAAEEARKAEELAKYCGYDPNRAAFVASILLCEAEMGMLKEKPQSYRYRVWKDAHDHALKIVKAYDKKINMEQGYAMAAKVVDFVNDEMAKVNP